VGLHWGWNLANGMLDPLLPHDTLDAHDGGLLSAAAHLLLVLLFGATASRRPATTDAR
jgi:hypothetical protein